MVFLRWLRSYWYLPLIGLGALLLWILSRGRVNPLIQIQNEIDAMRAESYAREMKHRHGLEIAKQKVYERYRSQLTELDAFQYRQAKELENDPIALARFLVRSVQ